MRTPMIFATVGAVALFAGGAAHAAQVELDDVVAKVTIVPEARSDVKVEIVREHPRLPLKIRTVGGRTFIDGGMMRKTMGCKSMGGRISVNVAGVGTLSEAELPQIVIRTPQNVDVDASGAVFGTIGRAARVDLSNAGCGDWTVANVSGRLNVNQAGSGDTRVGSAGEAKFRIAGSGDVQAGAIGGPVEIGVAGSGDIGIASVAGKLEVSVAGSGDVKVAGGTAEVMNVSIAGSGDVSFGGTAGSLTARVAGSGDISAHKVTGAVKKTTLGSGDVRVGS